ncbi:hypothetical protein DY240_09065 [Jiangella rhizosphaerae]|uniref:Uncharacterized protein n=1 Tax=Jiangella rhizosphaerae TaxID=2293569 RepID=A0A418KTH5_9ACTN|nr:hypothetical protein DY240_09065 [Jiangella rhizosphaerae]
MWGFTTGAGVGSTPAEVTGRPATTTYGSRVPVSATGDPRRRELFLRRRFVVRVQRKAVPARPPRPAGWGSRVGPVSRRKSGRFRDPGE